VLAAVLVTIDEWLQWRIAAISGARVPFMAAAPTIAISVFVFPLSAWIVSRLDRWRLGR
jgi:rod shape-determining protein MreD